MKVLITGSRDWEDSRPIEGWLKSVRATVLVHGDHWEGADALAKAAALRLGIEQRPYPAQWRALGSAAGPTRNQRMVDAEHIPSAPIEAAMGFATSGKSRGTWDCITRCVRAGIPIDVWGLSTRRHYNGVWFCAPNCSHWHDVFHEDCRWIPRKSPAAREATLFDSVSLVNDGKIKSSHELDPPGGEERDR